MMTVLSTPPQYIQFYYLFCQSVDFDHLFIFYADRNLAVGVSVSSRVLKLILLFYLALYFFCTIEYRLFVKSAHPVFPSISSNLNKVLSVSYPKY